MSIAELPNNSRSSYNTVGAEYERTPPQDLQAEQSVLGGMLLSKDAIADVVEVLKERDFYRPAHELIYNAILDLYSRGEPADAITVAAELTKNGEIARAGGAPVHTLIKAYTLSLSFSLAQVAHLCVARGLPPGHDGHEAAVLGLYLQVNTRVYI